MATELISAPSAARRQLICIGMSAPSTGRCIPSHAPRQVRRTFLPSVAVNVCVVATVSPSSTISMTKSRGTSSPGSSREAAVFAALARMPNQPTNDLGPVLREVGRRLARRTTIVVISSNPGPGLEREVEILRRRGSDVMLLTPPEEPER